MTILSVAYPFAPVGLDATGGAEQILALLDRGLSATGHRSLVIACPGSRVAGELIEVAIPEGIVDESARRTVWRRWRAAIRDAIGSHAVDLVHLHGVDFRQYLPPEGPPVLVTLHLPPSFYEAEVFHMARPRTYLVCVSRSQRLCCPAPDLIAGEIENGVYPGEPTQRNGTPGDYALALGRICPEKGFHLALAAAEQAGVPFYLGGRVFPYEEHISYFRRELAPRLRPPHLFLGPLALERKRAMLAGARCLLVPSLVAETSSLVAMEALSQGTPVVAFPSGALPEIVADGRTGFVVNTVTEMAAAIRKVAQIDPAECRRVARTRFSAARMIGKYLRLYEDLLSRRAYTALPEPLPYGRGSV